MRTGFPVIIFASIAFILLAGCSDQPDEAMPVKERQPTHAVAGDELKIVTGQRLYVPAYSEIYVGDKDSTRDMTVTLSIRNTNLDKPIFIGSVKYFDTNGQLVTEYVESPLRLAPMATAEFIIKRSDDRGGTGANFIVGWGAEERVFEPVVEAVMVSIAGTQGLSLLSTARVLEEKQ